MGEKSANNDIDISKNESSYSQQYRKLELANFKYQTHRTNKKNTKRIAVISGRLTQAWRQNKIEKSNTNGSYISQYELFRKTTKLLVILGQCIGLNPVIGVLERDLTKIRFSVKSFRFAYSFLLFIAQAVVTAFCLWGLATNKLSITVLGHVSFYISTTLSTAQFIRISMKWPYLVQKLNSLNLDNHVEPRIIKKCIRTIIIFVLFAIIEHTLAILARLQTIGVLQPNVLNPYEAYLKHIFPFIFNTEVQYHTVTAIILQCVSFTCTFNWTYSDVYIIVISNYLDSIFEDINKKITIAINTMASPSEWLILRNNYNNATRLVFAFDEVIDAIVLNSFMSNLFFICLKIFNLQATLLQKDTDSVSQKSSQLDLHSGWSQWIMKGTQEVYYIYSPVFVVIRFLSVTLLMSNINLTTTKTAQLLYNVPASIYCDEVHRFVEQVHGQTVALTGMKFFSVTKDIVLSVAGAIVTYELVLLQFNGQNNNSS